jgi:GH43 family beta-xylosidase
VSLRKLLGALVVLVLAAVSAFAAVRLAPAAQAAASTFTNPINSSGADPWMTYHQGNYYLMTTPYSGALTMRRASTIAALKTTSPSPVFNAHAPGRDSLIWAPEFHLLSGPNGQRWYIYYSAGPGEVSAQRVHVLESAGTDPMGPYAYKGMLFSATNWWSIDASVLTINGQLYVLWSGTPGGTTYSGAPSVYITALSNPWTAGTTRLQLSTPTYDWERQLWSINEGPAALQHNGRTFVVYSASGCGGPDYKLGLLTYNGGNVLSAGSWTKSPTPVFQRNDAAGVFGPGHNGFFTSPDGTEDWIVYHANDSASSGCGDTRSTRIQKLTWNADGTPNLGTPVSRSTALPVPSGEGGTTTPPPSTPPATTSPPPTPPTPSAGTRTCAATYKLVNSWSGGYQGEVNVANNGSTTLGGWTVTMNLASGQTISQVWGGSHSTSGSTVTVRNAPWNGSLAPSTSTTYGFIGGGSPSAPTLTCATP